MSLLAAEARVEVVKQQEDGVKAEDAPENAAAEDNDELDIQLDEDVSLHLSSEHSLHTDTAMARNIVLRTLHC